MILEVFREKLSADANPKSSALVELLCELSPSTGPEHAAGRIAFFLLWVFSVHANEHLESDSIDPSTAMLSLGPRLWCLLSLFSQQSLLMFL